MNYMDAFDRNTAASIDQYSGHGETAADHFKNELSEGDMLKRMYEDFSAIQNAFGQGTSDEENEKNKKSFDTVCNRICLTAAECGLTIEKVDSFLANAETISKKINGEFSENHADIEQKFVHQDERMVKFAERLAEIAAPIKAKLPKQGNNA